MTEARLCGCDEDSPYDCCLSERDAYEHAACMCSCHGEWWADQTGEKDEPHDRGRPLLAAVVSPWRPISTAPKDGHPFLGGNAEHQKVWLITQWLVRYPDGSYHWDGFGGTYGVRPSHWAPLLEPPAGGEG